MKYIFTLVLSVVLTSGVSGSNVDSLLLRLSTASTIDRPGILIALCDANMNLDNEKALSFADEAITASLKVMDSTSLCKSYLMKGELLVSFNRFVEGRESLEKALILATKLRHMAYLSDVNGALGGLYASLFDHEKSLKYYQKGIELARQDSNDMLLVKNMNNMAYVFEVQGEFDLALRSFSECSQVLEGTRWFKQRIYYITLMNSGMVCNSLKRYEDAVGYLKRALSGFQTLELKSMEAHTLLGIVASYTELGQLDSAMSYYKSSTLLHSVDDYESFRHFRDQTYAELLYQMHRYSEVIALEKTKLDEIGRDTALSLFAANAAKLLYQTYKDLGAEKNALEYLEKYNEYNQQVVNQRTEDEVKSMRIRFETELDFEANRRELLELQIKDDVQRREIQRQKSMKNITLVIALLGLIISFLILSGLKLKKQASEAISKRLETENINLKQEVEHKNRELSSTAMFVAQKNQMLMNLQNHLSKLSKPDEGISTQDLRVIRNQIKDNIQLEEDWERIKLHFEEVYPRFFANLKSEYPQLTPLELKHCAYLKMGLSIKEVARMLSVAHKSVQMSHYRLKKKLALGADDNLAGYLSDF